LDDWLAPNSSKRYFFDCARDRPGLRTDRVVRPFLAAVFVFGLFEQALIAEPWKTTVEGWVVITERLGRLPRQVVENESQHEDGSPLVEWIVAVPALG
jgi:hypothetical protein